MDHCRLEASPNHCGLVAVDGATVTVRNTVASGNAQTGFEIASESSRSTEVNIENCIASNNGVNGVGLFQGGSGKVIARVSDSTITDNAGNGFQNGGGQILSRRNNTVAGNGAGDTSGTITTYTAQ
ncbi:MAG TPA: right-handed parallel beta-helix repeat-containing protein, partial [Blastocatellia bacterium]